MLNLEWLYDFGVWLPDYINTVGKPILIVLWLVCNNKPPGLCGSGGWAMRMIARAAIGAGMAMSCCTALPWVGRRRCLENAEKAT